MNTLKLSFCVLFALLLFPINGNAQNQIHINSQIMKLIRKLSFILITFPFLLSACATGENLEYPVFTIELGRNSSEYIFLKDLFEAKEWVVLDTCKDCIISSIDKIECADNDIYILDKVRRKCVYRFSKEGKYKNTIGVYGKGNGEYIDIYDFTIEPLNGNILILGNDSKVYVYDKHGTFLESKNVSKTRLWNIQATKDGIFMSTNHSTFVSGDDAFLLYKFDFSLNFVDKWNRVLPQHTSVMPMSSFVFQGLRNELSYIDQKQNRIFLFSKKDNKFNKNIEISFPNPRPISHYNDAMIFMEKENQQKYDWLCEVLRSKDKIVATYFRNGKYCVSVADSRNGKIIKEGILAGIMPQIYPLSNDEYIAAIDPEIYISNNLRDEFSTRPKQEITEESNMLIVRFKLK